MLKGYTILEDVESGCLLRQYTACARLSCWDIPDFDGCSCVADIVLQFLYRVWIWFVYRTFEVSPERISPPPAGGGRWRRRNFLWGHFKSTVYESNPHTIQELKDNISHAVAAIKITLLHRVYLNTVTAQLLANCSNTLRDIPYILESNPQ